MAGPDLNALLRQAVSAHQAGRLAPAAAGYAQVRRLAPRAFDAWHLGGLVELQQERYAPAVELLTRARSLNPRDAVCAMRLGIALQNVGPTSRAIEALNAAVRLQPTLAEAWYHLGNAHATDTSSGNEAPERATAAWTEAVRHRPDFAEAHDRLGGLALTQQGYAAAEPHFRAAVAARPDWAQAWCNLGLVLIYQGPPAEAAACLRRALQLEPQLGKAHCLSGLLAQRSYRLPEAVTAFERALALNPADIEAASGRLLTLHYLDEVTPADLAAAHREFGARLVGSDGTEATRQREPTGTPREPGGPRRLRVGFVSADLRAHSVAWFLLPLVQHLDREQFEICLYHDHAIEDDVTAQFRALADRWANLRGLSDAAVVQRLRGEQLDLAIDLGGHTGVHRLGVFARRIAPVQITYLGYPDTTGVPAMDFRFVDAMTDPAPAADAGATERLVRFAPTAWSYAPPRAAPEVSLPPSSRTAETFGGITFGSFNTLAKVSDATVALWARVLQDVPDSRLWLKSGGLDDTATRAGLIERFARQGIAAERLVLRDRCATIEAHLASYGDIDIALDPLPYHGTTTTCEALWMGRPVVTLQGDHHASRVGGSLLSALGRTEWIATNPAEYVAIAARLAADRPGLASAAQTLRSELQCSALLDHRGQARRFGAALRECWATHPPEGGEIAAPVGDRRELAGVA